MGVKCIKTDFGENIHMDHSYHAATPERLNNIYALLYQRAAYEVTKDVTGSGIIGHAQPGPVVSATLFIGAVIQNHRGTAWRAR